jgi:hypothetical protein
MSKNLYYKHDVQSNNRYLCPRKILQDETCNICFFVNNHNIVVHSHDMGLALLRRDFAVCKPCKRKQDLLLRG